MRPIDEKRLERVYKYIVEFQNANGRTPTYREIQKDCKYSTTSVIAADINRLRQRNLLSQGEEYQPIMLPVNQRISRIQGASILGAVRCGQPNQAIENIESTVALPEEIFGSGEHFILHAKGDSMIKRGIFDGDLIVVEKRETAELGEVVVALIGDEATTKVLAKKKGKFYLKPANDKYEDICPEEGFKILGVVRNTIHTVPGRDYNLEGCN